MRYLEEVEILHKQENLHAEIHTKFMKSHPASPRYKHFKKLLKFILLETPRWFSENALGNIETSFGNSVWISQIPIGNFWTNILVFHWFEESEHGVVTCNRFKNKYNAFVRLLLSPIAILFLAILWVYPILMKILTNPIVLIFPSTYFYLIQYLMGALLGMFIHIGECILFWLMPFEHAKGYYNFVRASFEKLVKERKIEFKVIEEKEYHY